MQMLYPIKGIHADKRIMEEAAMEYAMNQAPQRVLDMRKAWATGDAIRDTGLTEPESVEKFRDISYGPYDTWNLLDLYLPKDAGKDTDCALPVIVSIHGGGFFYGDKELYRFYCMHLAEFGFAVVNYNYRLAPEFHFPAPIEDAAAVLRWISANAESFGLDKCNVFMVGDSAGAQLVSQMACILSNSEYADLFGLDLPKDVTLRAVSLACGVYNFPTAAEAGEEGIFIDYFGEASVLDDERAKVLDHITADYPPAFVFSAYCDTLYAACEPMAKLIAERGGESEFRIYGAPDKPEISHVFHVNMKLAEGEKANRDQTEFFRRHMAWEDSCGAEDGSVRGAFGK